MKTHFLAFIAGGVISMLMLVLLIGGNDEQRH